MPWERGQQVPWEMRDHGCLGNQDVLLGERRKILQNWKTMDPKRRRWVQGHLRPSTLWRWRKSRKRNRGEEEGQETNNINDDIKKFAHDFLASSSGPRHRYFAHCYLTKPRTLIPLQPHCLELLKHRGDPVSPPQQTAIVMWKEEVFGPGSVIGQVEKRWEIIKEKKKTKRLLICVIQISKHFIYIILCRH